MTLAELWRELLSGSNVGQLFYMALVFVLVAGVSLLYEWLVRRGRS